MLSMDRDTIHDKDSFHDTIHDNDRHDSRQECGRDTIHDNDRFTSLINYPV